MDKRFHATISVSDDQIGEPSIVGPLRKTPKNAIKAAVVLAREIQEEVEIRLFESDDLLCTGFGHSPLAAQDELCGLLDRNKRRYQ